MRVNSIVIASVLMLFVTISITDTLLAEESASGNPSNDDRSKNNDDLILGLDRTQLLIVFVIVIVIVIMLGLIIYRILYLRKRRRAIEQEEVDPFTKEFGIYTNYDDMELITLKVDRTTENIEKRLRSSLSRDGIYLKTALRRKRSRRR